MISFDTFTLLINGLTLSLALGFLLIVLWHDARKELNQFFAIFLIFVTIWHAGSFLFQGTILLSQETILSVIAIGMIEIGFMGAGISVYVLTTILAGVQTARLRVLAFLSLLVISTYRIFLIVTTANISLQPQTQQPAPSIIFYLTFNILTLYLLWHYRQKLQIKSVGIGIAIFILGQSLTILNPSISITSFVTNISALGVITASFGLLRQEIIAPLEERIRQVESMHRVSVAITSRIATDTVLSEIASQATEWLNTDAAAIFLKTDSKLKLATVYNLPESYINHEVELGTGIVGTAALTHKTIYLQNYRRDWTGKDDLPLARDTFGSVICTPLIYDREVVGVLLVISGLQGRLFDKNAVHLLELLGAQAAVAISHVTLFNEQRKLTDAVETARSQLETVLVSTESPVIAVDRHFRLIFSNPAARKLLIKYDNSLTEHLNVDRVKSLLPVSYREVITNLKQKGSYVCEVNLDDKIYLCHLASLGKPKPAGWVAVLNDVTQLIELNRIRSEMVRMTSHDLKNPLQAAIANIDLLRDDLNVITDNSEVFLSIDTIEKQLNRMNRIIRGILDLERVKLSPLAGEICIPDEIIKTAVDEIAYLAKDQGIHIYTEIMPEIGRFSGDFEQFVRAMTNLIENAIKFTPRGGDVWISVSQKDAEIVFRIKDTGIGIPPELHSKVFDRFFRGRQEGVEHVSGSGLGLSLVRTVVENHKGRVWIESETVGTSFYLTVPIEYHVTPTTSSHSQ